MNGRTLKEPLFEQIEAISMTERVIAALKAAFFSGKLLPGDPLIERKIAREMNVGTPVVREALISLKHDGFVRRVNNRGTVVTKFAAEEIRKLYMLRVELETLAIQWARTRVTEADLIHLTQFVEELAEAGRKSDRQAFLEKDFQFHRYCWYLSGNEFLAETLERLMSPLFAFVVLASESPLTESMAKEHQIIVEALRSAEEPEFSAIVRGCFTVFALRWISAAPSLAGMQGQE
jgi:DNA-binding GntR family transcriptional regulator